MNTEILPYLIVILFFLATACNSNTDKTASTNKEVQINTTSEESDISKAEKGITIVLPDGWPQSEMDFQQSYCESMMASLDNFNGTKFCECFLGRIQYYYKPIHAREAYEDQKRWNEECYGLAQE